MLFAQKTREQEYLEQCDAAVAQGLQQLIGTYYYTRAIFLGKPVPTGQQMPNGAPQFGVSGDADFKLRDRIEALGTRFGSAMAEAEQLRQFVEARIAVALQDLGGIENVRGNGPFRFLLNLAKRDTEGKVVGYKGLEANPYREIRNSNIPGAKPQEFEVTLSVNPDGTGNADIVPVNGTPASSDPF